MLYWTVLKEVTGRADRGTDRQRERERERERQTQTDRERETERQRESESRLRKGDKNHLWLKEPLLFS